MLLVAVTVAFMPVYSTNAWKTSQEAGAVCTDNSVVIKATFKNTEKNSQAAMDVTPTDLQSGVSGDTKTVNPGEEAIWEIDTGLNSVSAGEVEFYLTWTNGNKGTDKRKVSYEAINCKGEEEPEGSITYSAEVACEEESVVINVQVKNNDNSDSNYVVEITPKDKQTGITGDTRTLNSGDSETWKLDTNLTSIDSGEVELRVKVNSGDTEKHTVSYNASECEQPEEPEEPVCSYGGGDCIVNKSFDIEKKVRIKGDKSWKDKVTGVTEDDEVEFRIVVKNNTDSGDVDDVEFDNMRMHDFLPDELAKLSGDLTEDWDNFKPGEERTFYITVKVNSEEYDRTDFSKCVVNEAVAKYDDNEEASDTATVCYENGEVLSIEELPRTGATSTVVLTLLGLTSITSGFALKKRQ